MSMTMFEEGDRFGTIVNGEARVWFVNAAGLPEAVFPIEYGCGDPPPEGPPEPRPLLVPYRNDAGEWAVDLPPLAGAGVAASGGTLVFPSNYPLTTVAAFVESFTEGTKG